MMDDELLIRVRIPNSDAEARWWQSLQEYPMGLMGTRLDVHYHIIEGCMLCMIQ